MTATASPSGNFPPSSAAATQADVLSQVLTLIRLRGKLVYTARLGGAWGLEFEAGAAHFHYIESGCAWVRSAAGEPLLVSAGDMVLLPHGSRHFLSDTPATPTVGVATVLDSHFDTRTSALEYGSGEPTTRIVAGLFHFEGESLAAVLAALPPVVHIASEDGRTPDWLNVITHFLVKEAHAAEPGSSLMISRLIDLLVIRTLRTWVANQSRPGSWLGGLGEERIGRVLNTIHAAPFHPWTVRELASLAAMSRSIFAERFAARVGEAPLHYVKRWKLTLAADMLASGGLRVTQAAERTGYTSDAAFSRAFKTQFGYPPSEAQLRHGGAGSALV